LGSHSGEAEAEARDFVALREEIFGEPSLENLQIPRSDQVILDFFRRRVRIVRVASQVAPHAPSAKPRAV
jgi:hypothetical protein